MIEYNHMQKETIFWYDLETFGLNPNYDRIAQFAGIRTDLDLNIIEEPINLLCRLSPDYLPNPQSCLITKLTPSIVNKDGIIEAKFISLINKEFTRQNTIVAGFNNIKFDDEFIRNALYRNFYDPYEREYTNGCSRWDIIDLVRATHDLRPNGIFWNYKTEKGYPSIKLECLAKDNNLKQEHAHDALSDVEATIQVARMIRERNPKIFNWAITHRTKNEVKKLLDILHHTPVLYTAGEFTREEGFTKIVMPLIAKTNQSNIIYAFDLTCDIAPLLTSDPESSDNIEGLVKIHINKAPFMAPLQTLDKESEKRLGFDMDKIMERAQQLKNETKLFKALAGKKDMEFPLEKDPDLRLYQDGFTTKRDKDNFSLIRKTKPQERLSLMKLLFDSEKAPQMLFRHVGRNWPQLLDEERKIQWNNFCAARLLSPPGENSISFEYYMRKLDEIINDINVPGNDKVIALDLKNYGAYLAKNLLQKTKDN